MSFNLNEWIAKKKTEWIEMEDHFKWIIYIILACSPVLIYVRAKQHAEIEQHLEELEKKKNDKAHAGSNAGAQANAGGGGGGGNAADPANTIRGSNVLPQSYRNQGLETLAAKLDMAIAESKKATQGFSDQAAQVKSLNDRLNKYEMKDRISDRSGAKDGQAPVGANGSGGADQKSAVGFGLNQTLPGTNGAEKSADPAPVDFNQGFGGSTPAAAVPSRQMKSWGTDLSADKAPAKKEMPMVSLPTNSGIESVMLTGINARSNASGSMPAGSVTSANSVGAPFVTRVKGEAILPNRFKVSLLNDCFISGSGVAILSTEKAAVIADKLTCVSQTTGVIFETKIKAYGVDLDGNEGISGRVVTKQGSILAKAALAGVASGLGSAFNPQGISGYNSTATSGTQGIQYANPSLVAQQGIYGGVQSASTMLSKFYLDYAKEMFPVIEVDAGTRITWMLKETLDVPQKGR